MPFASKRYSLSKVFFWVAMIHCLIFLVTLGTIVTSMLPKGPYNWERFFSLQNILKHFTGFIVISIFFYYALNLYEQLFIKKRSILFFAAISALGVIEIIFYNISMDLIFLPDKADDLLSLAEMFFYYSLNGIFTLSIVLIIVYLNRLKDIRRQKTLLEAEKMQLEIKNSEANLNFLKAQINPHFLHNTLNFLYSKAIPLSEELSEGILTLSQIMRYALTDHHCIQGKANLEEEITHLQNLIKIYQLRFRSILNVNFTISGDLTGKTIVPFVLITIVENAFKHGDLRNERYPIEIKLTVNEGGLHFYCRNKKSTGPKEPSTGIGLGNIKFQLQTAYGKHYNLKINDEEQYYTTHLIIAEL